MGNCFSVDKENDEQTIVPKAQPPGNYPSPAAVADPPSVRPRRPVKKRPQQKQTEQSEKESPTFPENARSDVMAHGPLPQQAPVTPSKSTEDNETKKPKTEIDKVKLETKAKVSSIYENSKKMAPETKPEYDKLKLKLGQLDQKVQNAINKNKMRQSILQDFREEFEKIINQTKKLSSENQIIELNYKIAQFQKRYFDYFGYKSEMPSVDVASGTAEPKPSHPYNLRPRPRSNQQTVTPEQNITKRPNSRSDCIPLNQFQSLNTSPGDVEEAREADSNAVTVPSDISFENETPKYPKTRGWEDTPKVHNSVNTTRYQNASKNQSYRDKVVSTESQKENLKNRQPQGHGHSFTIYGTNGSRLHHTSGDCKNQERYVSEKRLEITPSKEKEFKDQKNYENNKIDTNQKTIPSSLLENEPSKYEDQETKHKQKSKLIEEKRIFFETAHGTGEVISYSSGYQPKRQFVTTTKALYNYYPNEEKSGENEREQHRLEVEKQAEAASRNMANQISTSSFDRKTLRGEEANRPLLPSQTEEEKRNYGASGKSLSYEINVDDSNCNYRITQGWTWHDKFQENSYRINQSNNYPKTITQSERKHDDMHSSRQCSHHNREQTATQLVSSYQGYNQNQGFETSQEKAISSNQYGSLHDRNEGKTISDTQYRYTEDVEKFFQQFAQKDPKHSKSETYPEARSSANQYYDVNIQMKPTSQQKLPEHQCRGRGRLQIEKYLKPEDLNTNETTKIDRPHQYHKETSRFSQDQKIPEEKHPEQYYHSDQLPKHESVEEIAEEAKEEQMEILDVHQYFQNDFDLKTLKDKEPLEQIENVRSFAKNYENGVRNFSGANYSLEYFVLDEKLMRLIEHLDKLKCQDDKEATKRKIAVIEYITNLHNILDQRATD